LVLAVRVVDAPEVTRDRRADLLGLRLGQRRHPVTGRFERFFGSQTVDELDLLLIGRVGGRLACARAGRCLVG
jgi:septal ring factor EnvC (AmiA/AmiB activator)